MPTSGDHRNGSHDSSSSDDHVVLAGIDGGGTRTRVVLANAAGHCLARGEGGPGNYHDVGLDQLCRHFRDAFDAAWSQLGVSPHPLRAACFGLASVNTAAECDLIRKRVCALVELQRAQVEVVHDLRIAHAGALEGQPGIVLIVGTGSSCWGLDGAGASWQAGGWGSLLDDGGSASFLGIGAMKGAVRASDGRGPETTLTAAIQEHFELRELRDLLKLIDHDGVPRQRIAELAPSVIAAFEGGDGVATDIVAQGVDELVTCAVSVFDHLTFDEPFPVAASGGLVQSAASYRQLLQQRLAGALPLARPIDPLWPPVFGAVKIAQQLNS